MADTPATLRPLTRTAKKTVSTQEPILKNLSPHLTGSLHLRSFREGDISIPLSDIIMVQAHQAYANICSTSRPDYFASYNIRTLEPQFDPRFFFRIHKSSLINMLHIIKIKKVIDGKSLTLTNNYKPEISRRKWTQFETRFNELLDGKI